MNRIDTRGVRRHTAAIESHNTERMKRDYERLFYLGNEEPPLPQFDR